MATQPLNPISASLPITQKGDLPSNQFVQAINGLFSQLGGQINQLVAATAAANAAAQAAAAAQQTANAPPSGATKGSNTSTGLTINSLGWTAGPQVDLVGVVAGNLTFSATMAGDVTGGALTGGTVYDPVNGSQTAAGTFRLVEIDGATETVVYTAAFQAYEVLYLAYGVAYFYINYDASAIAAFVDARVSVGAISYRLDLRMGTPSTAIASHVTAYLFVNRA